MTISETNIIVRNPAAVETTVGSEVILMTLESGECLGLGETGSDVWRLIEKPTRLAPLVESLSGMYQAPTGVIEDDVVELLEDMLQRGLIQIS